MCIFCVFIVQSARGNVHHVCFTSAQQVFTWQAYPASTAEILKKAARQSHRQRTTLQKIESVTTLCFAKFIFSEMLSTTSLYHPQPPRLFVQYWTSSNRTSRNFIVASRNIFIQPQIARCVSQKLVKDAPFVLIFRITI